MYQIWTSGGSGLKKGPRFAALRDAVRFASRHRLVASCAIALPSGGFHRFEHYGCILHRPGRELA